MLSPQVLKHHSSLLEHSRLKPPRNNKEGKELESRFPWPLLVHRYPMIPFRKPNDLTDRTYDGFAIVTQHGGCKEPAELIKDLHMYENKLDDLMVFAAEPSAQRKYQATKKWVRQVQLDWHKVIKVSYWSNRYDS